MCLILPKVAEDLPQLTLSFPFKNCLVLWLFIFLTALMIWKNLNTHMIAVLFSMKQHYFLNHVYSATVRLISYNTHISLTDSAFFFFWNSLNKLYSNKFPLPPQECTVPTMRCLNIFSNSFHCITL